MLKRKYPNLSRKNFPLQSLNNFYKTHQKSQSPNAPSTNTYEFYNSTKQRSSVNPSKRQSSQASRKTLRGPFFNTLQKPPTPLQPVRNAAAALRSSSQINQTIFGSSEYLKDPKSNSKFVFEVYLSSEKIDKNFIFDSFFKAELDSQMNSKTNFVNYRMKTPKCEEGKGLKGFEGGGRRIDLGKFRETEKVAAEIIQRAWRSFKCRREEEESRVGLELKKAEDKAKKALEEYEQLKTKLKSIKKGICN